MSCRDNAIKQYAEAIKNGTEVDALTISEDFNYISSVIIYMNEQAVSPAEKANASLVATAFQDMIALFAARVISRMK